MAILTATKKNSSSGVDLKAAADGDAVDGDYGVGGFGGLQELRGLNKPAICAGNGICCGGGLEIALFATLFWRRIMPVLRCPKFAVAPLPMRQHQAAQAYSLLYCNGNVADGPLLVAVGVARWGMINRVHSSADLMPEARKMAELLASGPPLVYAAIKEVVREAEDMKFQDCLNKITQSQFETIDVLYHSEDQLEGARAFAEKRDPVWKGR